MSLKASTKIDTNRYEVEVEIGAEEFKKAVDKAFAKHAPKISIPGFRKGKAPKAFIEKYYGKEVFYEDAINFAYPAALYSAAKEAGLEIVGLDSDINVTEVGENGLQFKAQVTVKPEIEIDGYKGLEVSVEALEVTDEDIDAEIRNIRERNARLITVEDRAAQKGDIAVIDFEGFCDGVAFDGGKSENYSLELGGGKFIAGFEEQVEGHNAGEEFDINVTFPAEYQSERLAGKDAVFKIKLHEIKVRELPELDDEFVKDVSEFDTVAEYREDVKAKLSAQNKEKTEIEIENKLVDKLTELVNAEIPEVMYENKINEIAREFEYRLHTQGLDVESYKKYTGMDDEKYLSTFRPQAEKQVKIRLALDKIAQIENLKAEESDVNAEYEKMAKEYRMDAENLKKMIPLEDVEKDVIVGKAIKFVREHAVIA